MGVKSYLIVALICIPLMISDVFIGHLYIFFGEMSIQVLCTFSNWVALCVEL